MMRVVFCSVIFAMALVMVSQANEEMVMPPPVMIAKVPNHAPLRVRGYIDRECEASSVSEDNCVRCDVGGGRTIPGGATFTGHAFGMCLVCGPCEADAMSCLGYPPEDEHCEGMDEE